MKAQRTFFCLVLIFALSSCEKINFVKDLSGIWELSGAGEGEPHMNRKMNFTHLVLDHNKYFIYSEDTLKASGIYSLYGSGYNSKSFFEEYYIKFNKGTVLNPDLIFPIDEDLDVHIQNSDTLVFYQRGYADGLGLSFINPASKYTY